MSRFRRPLQIWLLTLLALFCQRHASLADDSAGPQATKATGSLGTTGAKEAAPAVLSPVEKAAVHYERDVKSLLEKRCFACHGSLAQKAGLRLDTGELIRKGGDSGAAVVPGNVAESLLIDRVSEPDPKLRMPPEGEPLSASEIGLLKQWVEQGAKTPANEQPQSDPRDHWAFRKPVKASLPRRLNGQPATHPVDAFINARLDAAKLPPRPLADKPTLLRRITLDLIGLPPTRDELHAFLADESPEAYDTVVNRLLSDPRYGERWGRHWMDVWRYADWHGRRHVPDVWNSAPQVWRWRDWIVKSLNQDHGYDRMVQEMLAADEVASDNPEAAVATAYLIRNWYALNPNDWMRANVEHTSKAFLGLTLNCAHCHDHKYDPITQDDYFRFRALFEPINIRQDRFPGEADPGAFQEYQYSVLRKIQRLGAIQVFDKNPAATTWFYTGGDERNRVTSRGSVPPGVPAFLAGTQFKIEPVQLPLTAWYPAMRPEILETLLTEQQAAVSAAETQLVTVRRDLEQTLPPLREKLIAAEARYTQARRDLEASGNLGVLAGQQSLLLNAATGRRAIQNGLTGLKSLENGTTISLQLRILQESHVNFQLAKDVVQGLTASYVGFEKGRILAYHPGGFSEFQAGTYDFASGQYRFEISLVLDLIADRCLLTVRSVSDGKILVDQTPIALNGWNPVGDPRKAISFDARPGTIALVDEIKIQGPSTATPQNTPSNYFSFEPPVYPDQRDIDGIDGWQISQFSLPGATSTVTSVIGNDALLALTQEVSQARRAVASQELLAKGWEAKIAAAKAEIMAISARAMADRAKFGVSPSGNLGQPNSAGGSLPAGENLPAGEVERLAKMASAACRESALKKAEAEVLTADQALAAAELKPASDAKRVPEMEAAGKKLAAARTALASAASEMNQSASAMTYPSLGTTYPATSTGRRRALVQWITSPENPLAARVAVNHLWLRHFHTPLVATVFDFGRNGAKPTHPELLDWLAVELIESGWSMKHLHRLLVTSEAYRRVSSVGDPVVYASNPDNTLLWRMNTGRMEAEVVRDSVLALAGRLDLKMGGQELENSEAFKTFRRTLYYSCQPELDGKNEFGALFDAPEPAECYRRTRSIIPQQSLALTNSALVHDVSVQLAGSLWRELTPQQQLDSSAFVASAFEQILTRQPTVQERDACLDFLKPSAPPAAGAAIPAATDPVRQREGLIRALLNHNDFISIR